MYRVTQRIRVEWAHCDPAGIIYNPNYYIWMDQGTHHLLEACGFPFAEAVRSTEFRGCPLVASNAEFIAPANFSDVLLLTSQVERFGNKSFTVAHEFTRDDTALARGKEIRVWATTDPADPARMVGTPMPEDLRARLRNPGTKDVSP